MKRLHLELALLTLLAPLALGEACVDGSCTLPQAEAAATALAAMPSVNVQPQPQAPRLTTLKGKTFALVGGSFMASVTHPELKRLIL